MPQISAREFQGLPLRVHKFLAGVPLHDAWMVELPRLRPGITLHEFLQETNERIFRPSPAVRGLLSLRFLIGRLFKWDRPRMSTQVEPTFADRLTDADRTQSLTPAGVREGHFRSIYEFENEKLVELLNRTVHAAALSALFEDANCYRFYFAVYVRNVSRLTPFYMAAIAPFRRLIVYPSLLRSVRANWNRTMAAS